MTPIKRGSTYYAVWTCTAGTCDQHTESARHWVSLRTGDKREAKAACDELSERLAYERRQIKLGLPIDRKPSTMLRAVFKELYLSNTDKDKAESTHKTEAYHLKSLLEYVGATARVSSLNQDTLEAYKKHRLKTIATRSWNSELATLKSVFV